MRSVMPAGWKLKAAAIILFLALLGLGARLAAVVVGVPLVLLVLLRRSTGDRQTS